MFDRDGNNVPDRVKISVVSRQLEHGVVVAVNGELDLVSAPIVGSELEKAAQSLDLVAIDLTETTFIDSAGLHMLIAADRSLRERGGHLVIVGAPPQARRVMEITGMDERFDMVSDISELERRISSSGVSLHARASEPRQAPASAPAASWFWA